MTVIVLLGYPCCRTGEHYYPVLLKLALSVTKFLFDFDLIVQSDIPCGKARFEFDLIWSLKASFFDFVV